MMRITIKILMSMVAVLLLASCSSSDKDSALVDLFSSVKTNLHYSNTGTAMTISSSSASKDCSKILARGVEESVTLKNCGSAALVQAATADNSKGDGAVCLLLQPTSGFSEASWTKALKNIYPSADTTGIGALQVTNAYIKDINVWVDCKENSNDLTDSNGDKAPITFGLVHAILDYQNGIAKTLS